jgi:hypothetical protein
MPKYESDNDKKQRTDAALKKQQDAQADQAAKLHKTDRPNVVNPNPDRPIASQDPSAHTNVDTASTLDPDEQAQQDAGNKEIQDLRHKHHKEKSGSSDEAKAQRLGEVDARFEQRKAEMERQHESTVHPPPQVPATNPSNITSPATHIDIDTTMGEGEP